MAAAAASAEEEASCLVPAAVSVLCRKLSLEHVSCLQYEWMDYSIKSDQQRFGSMGLQGACLLYDPQVSD